MSQIFLIFTDRGGLNFLEGAIRSAQKSCPPPSQHFSFSHYYLPITPRPRPCMLPEKQSKCAQNLTTLS